MPNIDCTLEAFATRANGLQSVPVSALELITAAAVVGMPTIASHPASRRPLLEMLWRVGLVITNIRPTIDGLHWTRTDAYNNLDPSEKTSVSYFLGMTQAALTARLVLGYPHLVHVDVLLRHQGTLLTGTRPDFVAVDARNTTAYVAVVEAKGRTNGFDRPALTTAKAQTATTPTIKGLAPQEAVASEAYFNDATHWSSVLADPNWVGGELEFGLETYLFNYYRTVIDAGRDAPDWTLDGAAYRFELPGFPIVLRIPVALVDAYDASIEFNDDERRDAAAPLVRAYRDLEQNGYTGDLIRSALRDGATDEDLLAVFETADA